LNLWLPGFWAAIFTTRSFDVKISKIILITIAWANALSLFSCREAAAQNGNKKPEEGSVIIKLPEVPKPHGQVPPTSLFP